MFKMARILDFRLIIDTMCAFGGIGCWRGVGGPTLVSDRKRSDGGTEPRGPGKTVFPAVFHLA